MTLNRFAIFLAMLAFLYTIAFEIFVNNFFRVPAPLLFGAVLLFFVRKPIPNFSYQRELAVIIIALFLINIVSTFEYISFIARVITIVSCACYFNYFVGNSISRYKVSIVVFFCLLAISMIVLFFDHMNPSLVDPLREMALGDEILQSPSGIATTQFSFGYQLAAFCTFAAVAVISHQRSILLIIAVSCLCFVFLYLGMNRSAFLVFAFASSLFIIAYYKWKAILVLIVISLAILGFYTTVLKDNTSDKNNILAKNQAKEANDFNRGTMAIENLKILAEYPYGLMFYGKTWEEVTYRSPIFIGGISSHNAYLMFITYLGPFLGLGLLAIIYLPIFKLFWRNLTVIRLRRNALFTAILFSFMAVTLNAFSHTGWLLTVDGPTMFLYFALLHYDKLETAEDQLVTEETMPSVRFST